MKDESLGEIRGFCCATERRLAMPRKPDKPCSYPGCPKLVPAGQTFCSEHMKQMNQRYERYERDPATRSRYGKQWKRIRYKYVQEHPFCEECMKHGELVLTEQVHHIVPLAEGGTNDESNLMSLCKSCHSRIHAIRGDRWGGPKPSDSKG